MTREEAIKILKAIRVYECYPKSASEETKEAIDMAIEALQERSNVQNMHNGDLISKADAIELCAEAQGRASTKSELKGISKIWQGLLKLPSAEAVHGDGRNNMKRYPNCQMRTSLGNCDAIGGFCTSVNAPICDAFHKLVKSAHGEWIEHKWAEECDGLLISNYECTNCHSWERNNTDFCPSCGARMKGEQNVDK